MQSILSQSYTSLEVILVDDGSEDNSYNVAKSYENEWIRVFRQSNSGAAVARNTGLDVSRGQYIQFLDAGDAISNDKIAAQVAALQANPRKVAVCYYKQFTLDEEIKNGILPDQSDFIYSSDDPQDFLINLWGGYGNMNFVQTNSWMVPRKLITAAGPWRYYRCPDDDGEFFARVLLSSKGIIYTPGVYNFYHAVSGGVNQLSKSKNHKYLMNTLLTIELKHQYLLKKGYHPKISKAIASQYLMYAVDVYSSQPVLSKIAYRRYKRLNENAKIPVLGGPLVELSKYMFGWRITKRIKAFLGKA